MFIFTRFKPLVVNKSEFKKGVQVEHSVSLSISIIASYCGIIITL